MWLAYLYFLFAHIQRPTAYVEDLIDIMKEQTHSVQGERYGLSVAGKPGARMCDVPQATVRLTCKLSDRLVQLFIHNTIRTYGTSHTKTMVSSFCQSPPVEGLSKRKIATV